MSTTFQKKGPLEVVISMCVPRKWAIVGFILPWETGTSIEIQSEIDNAVQKTHLCKENPVTNHIIRIQIQIQPKHIYQVKIS